jgi:uncharacterized membrane protein required for colicin V production
MRTVWSFLLALFMSVFLSQIVAQQLAVLFHSSEEFIAVMALLLLFAVICIVVLSLAFVTRHGAAKSLNRASIGLFGFAVLAVAAATIFGMSQSGWALPSPYDLKLIVEILLPALIVVVVQWWFVHRCFAKASARG